MTDEKMAKQYATKECCTTCANDFCKGKCECWTFAKNGFLAGLKAGIPEWHKYSERPVKKINALCFDIKQNKFILGFYDLEADEWLRYGGYETIHIDLWKEIELPKLN